MILESAERSAVALTFLTVLYAVINFQVSLPIPYGPIKKVDDDGQSRPYSQSRACFVSCIKTVGKEYGNQHGRAVTY
jgi:membrane-associated protease RseP (regulator of RpoE activity)